MVGGGPAYSISLLSSINYFDYRPLLIDLLPSVGRTSTMTNSSFTAINGLSCEPIPYNRYNRARYLPPAVRSTTSLGVSASNDVALGASQTTLSSFAAQYLAYTPRTLDSSINITLS